VKIKEIMTRNPILVPPSTTLREIQTIFNNNKIWSVFIGNSDQFIGIVSRQYFFGLSAKMNFSTSVDKIMSKNIITIDENVDVNDAIRIIKINRINGIGVTKNGKPCGIITKSDIKKRYHPKAFDTRDFPEEKKKKMTQCDYCNQKISGMPFTCRRCGGIFCDDHRLPESHNCSGVRRTYTKKITAEEAIHDLTSGNKEKRKNAAIQLEKLSWSPQTESQKAFFLFAYQRWDDLLKVGDSALDPLLSGLMDEDITIQEFSAQTLGNLGNPSAIEPLIQKLYDPHTQVRIAVALALNNLGWMPKNDNERISLIIAQQRWSDLDQFGKKIIDPLSAILKNENEDIRFQVISALCKIHDERVIEILTKSAQDRSKKVQHLALQRLIDLNSPRAVDALLISLKGSDATSKKFAMNGLIQLDTSAVTSLIDTLNRGYESDAIDIQFKKDIVEILGEIQDSRAIEPLLKISISSKSTLIREAAQEAIKKIELYNENIKQKSDLYCLNCYSNFIKNKPQILHFLNSSVDSVCRNCKSNKNYLENVKKVVLLLDDMDELHRFENGILNVNWFRVRRPIDMNEISIFNCTNDDIAELVMKLRNDSDFERKKKLKLIPVSIVKDLEISQAKINLLRNTFGNVQVVEKDTINRLGD
jgi:HEAT repeat protein